MKELQAHLFIERINMIKKIFIYIFIFLSIPFLSSSCGGKAKYLTDDMEFIKGQAFYCISNDNKICDNVNIYFKLKSNSTFEQIKKGQLSVQLILADNKLIDTEQNTLDSIQIEGQKIYFFGLSLKQKSNLKDVYATNIRFNHNEAQTYSIGKYHIKTNAFSTPKELSVVESPITQNVTPQLNSIQSISYKIMTTEKITDILNFEIEIPSEYKYIFEIIETKSELDKNTTDEMYKLYREHKSEKELDV